VATTAVSPSTVVEPFHIEIPEAQLDDLATAASSAASSDTPVNLKPSRANCARCWTRTDRRPMREPVFNETLQLGIVVRNLEATMRRYVDDYRMGRGRFTSSTPAKRRISASSVNPSSAPGALPSPRSARSSAVGITLAALVTIARAAGAAERRPRARRDHGPQPASSEAR
jgi:hypothetical protein